MPDVRVDVLAERALARKVRDGERLLSEMPKKPSTWFSHDALVGV
jgi:hypothetical protein